MAWRDMNLELLGLGFIDSENRLTYHFEPQILVPYRPFAGQVV